QYFAVMLKLLFTEFLRNLDVIARDLDHTDRRFELMGQVIDKIILQFEHPPVDLQVPEQQVGHQNQQAVHNDHHHRNGAEDIDDLRRDMILRGNKIEFVIGKGARKRNVGDHVIPAGFERIEDHRFDKDLFVQGRIPVFDRNRVRVQIEQHQVLVVPGFGQTVVEHQLLVHRDVVPAKRIEVTHAVVGDGVEYVELILGCKRLAGICNLNVAGQLYHGIDHAVTQLRKKFSVFGHLTHFKALLPFPLEFINLFGFRRETLHAQAVFDRMVSHFQIEEVDTLYKGIIGEVAVDELGRGGGIKEALIIGDLLQFIVHQFIVGLDGAVQNLRFIRIKTALDELRHELITQKKRDEQREGQQ